MREFQSSKVLRPKGAEEFSLPSEYLAETPVDLEIGCGVGFHPIQYSKKNPERYLIAIEHTREKFEKFEGRLKNHPDLKNILAIHADAVAWVTHCLKSKTISRCFILYPNPEPKASSRRWIRMPFMSKLIEVMRDDGEIVFSTNIRAYFDEICEYGSRDWNLKIKSTREINTELTPTFQPRTHFEKKYLERGETCFEIILKK